MCQTIQTVNIVLTASSDRCPVCLLQAAAGKLSVDGLLQMTSSELQDTMRRLSSNPEDRSRLAAALSCLKSAHKTGKLRILDYFFLVVVSFIESAEILFIVLELLILSLTWLIRSTFLLTVGQIEE